MQHFYLPRSDRSQRIEERLKTDGLPNTQSFERTSAARAARVTQTDYVREQFNQSAAVQYTIGRRLMISAPSTTCVASTSSRSTPTAFRFTNA
jgi:hypothetical protein